MTITKAYSVRDVLTKKFKGVELGDGFRDVIGTLELKGSWCIWGQSGSGKTTFLMMLCKAFSDAGMDVLYNSLEEGLSMSIQRAYQRTGIKTDDKVRLISEGVPELTERLNKAKAPKVVIIDSLRYAQLDWQSYRKFCKDTENTLKIWVTHAKGKEPNGEFAQAVRYDSNVKIYTEGHRAFITSRYSQTGEGTFDIWSEKAIVYWG